MSVTWLSDAVGGLRHAVGDFLEFRATVQHRSRLGRRVAPAYTAYWRRCQAAYGEHPVVAPDIRRAVDEFACKGFTSFWNAENEALVRPILARIRAEEDKELDIWDPEHRYRADIYTTFPEIEKLFRGTLGTFLTATYRSHFKIFYGILYKSERLLDAPIGSQLWHADGGPGTCINVMVYLKDVEREDGAMQALPWERSLDVFRKERHAVRERLAPRRADGGPLTRDELRDAKCEFYRDDIEARFAASVEQPVGKAGLVLPFRNNVLHRGGYPHPGRTRYVCVFHVYPSDRPTPWEQYRTRGIKKPASYPKDPAF